MGIMQEKIHRVIDLSQAFDYFLKIRIIICKGKSRAVHPSGPAENGSLRKKIKNVAYNQNSGYLRFFGILLTRSATNNIIAAPRPAGITA